MNDQLQAWEVKRKMGRARFVLLYGIIFWAIPVGVIVNFIIGWLDGFSESRIITSTIIWPITGVVFGTITWKKAEKKYQQSLISSQ
jgi:hypothetical protein